MHSLISFTVDGVHCRPPLHWEPVTVDVRPIMQEIECACRCATNLNCTDRCVDTSVDRFVWHAGDPVPRFRTAGVS